MKQAIEKAQVKNGQLKVNYHRKDPKEGEEFHFNQQVFIQNDSETNGVFWSSKQKIDRPNMHKNNRSSGRNRKAKMGEQKKKRRLFRNG